MIVAAATHLHHVEEVMGMAVSFDVRAPVPGPAAMSEVLGWLHHVDATFSTYRPDSDICRIGRGELDLSRADAGVREVLRRCVELTAVTDGAFDVFGLPERNGTCLDPSGFVKGWAIERAATMLEAAGARNLCLNAGGDIALRGSPMLDLPWRVGIQHPEQADALATVLRVRGPLAVATSATYQRGAHIFDPATHQPTTDLASVTVIGPDLGPADAFATAVFVMGLDGLAWIEERNGYDAYLITHEGTTGWSSGFDRAWPAEGEPLGPG